MQQKIIQVGNSVAITVPKKFAQEVGWQAGQEVEVLTNAADKSLLAQGKSPVAESQGALTPEFKQWLDGFNKKYKNVLTELAKK